MRDHLPIRRPHHLRSGERGWVWSARARARCRCAPSARPARACRCGGVRGSRSRWVEVEVGRGPSPISLSEPTSASSSSPVSSPSGRTGPVLSSCAIAQCACLFRRCTPRSSRCASCLRRCSDLRMHAAHPHAAPGSAVHRAEAHGVGSALRVGRGSRRSVRSRKACSACSARLTVSPPSPCPDHNLSVRYSCEGGREVGAGGAVLSVARPARDGGGARCASHLVPLGQRPRGG